MTRCSDARPASVPETRSTILVVEDEVLVRLAVGQFLRDRGYIVIEAVDTAEAMRAIRSEPAIALVFTDVMMPGGQDGQALAEWLGRHYPMIKVVIASGVRQAPRNGVPFLLKPYAFTELAALVERLLK